MNDIILQLVPLFFWTVLLAIPLYVMLKKTGNSMWLFALAFVPLFGPVFLV